MENFISTFIGLVNGPKLITIFILILLDFLAGIAVAIKGGTFQFSKLGSFLNTSVFALVGGYFLIGVFAAVEPSYAATVTGTFVIIDLTLAASFGSKVKKLGVPIPDSLNKLLGS